MQPPGIGGRRHARVGAGRGGGGLGQVAHKHAQLGLGRVADQHASRALHAHHHARLALVLPARDAHVVARLRARAARSALRTS